MAVAEIFGQERRDRIGLAGGLRHTEGLDVFQDCVLIRAAKAKAR
jgi:hypothetical protein